MSAVSALANEITDAQAAARLEGKAINEEYKRDMELQREWNDATTAVEANNLMEENLDLQDKMAHEKLDVEAKRARARQLEDQAKEQEFDSFAETQVERELSTGVDEPLNA